MRQRWWAKAQSLGRIVTAGFGRDVQKKRTQLMPRPSQSERTMMSRNSGCTGSHLDHATRHRSAGQPEMLTLIRVRAIQLWLQISYQIGLGYLGWIRRSMNIAKKGFDAVRLKNAVDPCIKRLYRILCSGVIALI